MEWSGGGGGVSGVVAERLMWELKWRFEKALLFMGKYANEPLKPLG